MSVKSDSRQDVGVSEEAVPATFNVNVATDRFYNLTITLRDSVNQDVLSSCWMPTGWETAWLTAAGAVALCSNAVHPPSSETVNATNSAAADAAEEHGGSTSSAAAAAAAAAAASDDAGSTQVTGFSFSERRFYKACHCFSHVAATFT
jgi:hypothetical protein